MSAGIKCPHCNKRNFTNDSNCVHCGKPLGHGGAAAGAPPTSGRAHPPPPISPPVPIPTPPRPGGVGSPFPVPTGSTSPVPVPSPAFPIRPPNWTYDLPAHLKKLGGVDLEGTIVSINELQIKASPNIISAVLKVTLAIILLPFRPLIVLSALIFGHKPQQEKETVYTIRLEQPDGKGAEVRVEGEIVTSLAIRGDYISIWGKDKAGALLARKIFNHTSGVETILRR